MCVENKSYTKSGKVTSQHESGLGRCPAGRLGTLVIRNAHDQWHVLHRPVEANGHRP